MAETIQGSGLWHVTLVEKDLVKQAGLNSDDFEQDFGFFKYKDRPVIVSHVHNEHLVVSIEGQEDEDLKKLMEGFSKVVEYQPFCKYISRPSGDKAVSLQTYEWDKLNPDGRFKELSGYSKEDLVRI